MSDVAHHWARSAIERSIEDGNLKGYPDGTFKPDKHITRAEFITLANKTFKKETAIKEGIPPFADIHPTDWYYSEMLTAYSDGYITGYLDQTLKPKQPINRQEVAIILQKILKANTENPSLTFTDLQQVPDWSREAIGTVVHHKIMSGYPDGSFRPATPITRAEAVVSLENAKEYASSKHTVSGVNGLITYKNQPVQGAAVKIYEIGRSTILKQVQTDTNGHFRLTLESGEYDLLVLAKDNKLGSSRIKVTNGFTTTDLILENGVQAKGKITDLNGRPFANTALLLSFGGPAFETSTDANGQFSTYLQPNRSYSLKLVLPLSGERKSLTFDMGKTDKDLGTLKLDEPNSTTPISGGGGSGGGSGSGGGNPTPPVTAPITTPTGQILPLNPAKITSVATLAFPIVNDQVLITFKDEVTEAQALEKIQQLNGTVVGFIQGLNDYQVQLNNPPPINQLQDLVDQLNNDPLVEVAALNEITLNTSTLFTPNDPWRQNASDSYIVEWDEDPRTTDRNWGLEAIFAPTAWELYLESEFNSPANKVKIGVIDEGFYPSHEDLIISQNHTFNPQGGPVRMGDHGTHVAGIIGAVHNNSKGMAGVTWNRDLYFSTPSELNSLGNTNRDFATSQTFAWKHSIVWMLNNGVKAINMSLGRNYYDNKAYYEANGVPYNYTGPMLSDSNSALVKMLIGDSQNYWGSFLSKLINRGHDFLILQSAGNDALDAKWNGWFAGINDPEIKKRIMVVGSIGKSSSMSGYYFSNFSGYGATVDVAAPGEAIYSTVRPASGNYVSYNGTSMATPMVTGLAGLLWNANPTLSASQVKEIIVSTADRTVSGPDRDYPIINAAAAVTKALNEYGQGPAPSQPTVTVLGQVTDAATQQRLTNAKVTAYRYQGAIRTLYSTTTTGDDGSYELFLSAGTYQIVFESDGYYPVTASESITNAEVNNPNRPVVFNPRLYLIPRSFVGTGTVRGKIVNALSGQPIDGVTLHFRRGVNSTTGPVLATTTTDGNGNYTIDTLETGNYTAEVGKDGFISSFISVLSIGGTARGNQNGTITPVLDEGQIRIILTWGDIPYDLDSHLTGPATEDLHGDIHGDRYHVWYSKKQVYSALSGDDIADLDVDDTASYGPETITIHKQISGVYRYSVHDFSNRVSDDSSALSDSNAQVTVMKGNSIVATFHVPMNRKGTVWTVFDMDGDTIIPINTFSYESNAGNISSFSPNNGLLSIMTVNSDILTSPDKNSGSVEIPVIPDQVPAPKPQEQTNQTPVAPAEEIPTAPATESIEPEPTEPSEETEETEETTETKLNLIAPTPE